MTSDHAKPRSTRLRRQVLLAIAPYLIAIALLFGLSAASMDLLSSMRAYVGGESLWSKGEKEAVSQLDRYAASGSEADFKAYLDAIRVPLGDRQARVELLSETPDLARATEGFRAGSNDPDDIPGLIMLFQRFHRISFMRQAIAIWTAGDHEIDEIVAAADDMHRVFAHSTTKAATSQSDAIALALARVHAANERATPLEEAFSATLGDASRKVRTLLYGVTLVLAMVLLAIAALLSLWMLRQNATIERALRTSEERLDLAVRGSNDGIWNWSQESDGVYLSPRAAELLRFPTAEVLHDDISPLLDLVHPDDQELVRVAVTSMLYSNAPLDIEFRLGAGSGPQRWAQVRGRALRVIDQHVVQVAGSITDITERKRADAWRRQLVADEQRRAEQAQIALLEQVQGKMGRELHDDLGQQLTGVAFLAKALEQRLSSASPTEREQTSWIVRLINQAIDRVRFMSRQLSPITIDELTLGKALTRLVEDISTIFGTRITLRMTEDEAGITGPHANQFFRIAQESISNALRHGQATHISVCLDAWENVARLAVCDNGHGFAVRDVDPNRSLGLRSMAIRAESLEGRLRIRSTARGTTLIVRSPDCARATRKFGSIERAA